MPQTKGKIPFLGRIPYRAAVPVLLAASLTLTVLLVVMLESWRSAVTDAIDLGAQPQEISHDDLFKVALLVLLLGATAVASLYILHYYRHALEQLAHAQQLTRSVLDNMITGVLHLDLAGNLVVANPSARKRLQLPADLTGATLGWFERQHPKLAELLRQAAEEGRFVQDHDICSTAPDGNPIWLRITTTPMSVSGGGPAGVITMVKDVTKMVSVEKQLRRLDRLAVTESLAAGIAHEIRNPLTAIDLNLRLLRDDVTSDSPVRTEIEEQFKILTEETRRLNRITEQFLTLSRRGAMPYRGTSPGDLVRHVLLLIASEATEKGIRVNSSISPDLPPVLGLPERLEQVILNLLVNAMEAMTNGGEIKVRVAAASTAGGPGIVITLEDQGPGIPEKYLSRVFDPYFTTKQYGTGIGLAIAHRIVTDHDGELTIENAATGGVVATIRLPAAIEETGAAADQTHESQSPAR